MALLDSVRDYLGKLAPERQNQEVKTNLDLLKQETVNGSGISWAICYCTLTQTQPYQHPTTRLFTGQMPFMLPNQQHQSTEGRDANLEQ